MSKEKGQSWSEAFTLNMIDAVNKLDQNPAKLEEFADGFDFEIAVSLRAKFTPDRLRNAAAFANALAEKLEDRARAEERAA